VIDDQPDPARVTRGADPAAVGPYLAKTLGDDRWLACTVDLISGGKSNLTYVVESAAGALVLRRPPLGGVLPTAHDMVREYRVITALRDTAVPVPRTYALCENPALLGAPFYLMERVAGPIVGRELPPGYADRPEQRRSTLGDPLADVGLLLVYWSDPDDAGARTDAMVTPAATAHEGFPRRREVVELYAARSGRDVSALPWYQAFGFFKLAVVCAGIAARHRAGAMIGDGFEDVGARVAPLVDLGRAALAEGVVE